MKSVWKNAPSLKITERSLLPLFSHSHTELTPDRCAALPSCETAVPTVLVGQTPLMCKVTHGFTLRTGVFRRWKLDYFVAWKGKRKFE